MSRVSSARSELRELDDLAAGDSILHRLHPLAKLLSTALFIAVTVSFGKYDLPGVTVMVLYPVVLFQLAGFSVSSCFYKMRYILPLILAVGIVNPFLDRRIMVRIGFFTVSAGVISMVTLMLKGAFCLMASFLLISTTRITDLCAGLRVVHVPEVLVTLLLLTCRYISVMLEQAAVMQEAYSLRAPGQKGIHISAWGSFLGQLLLRSMDKANELYQSMCLRGFSGKYPVAADAYMKGRDWAFFTISSLFFVCARMIPLASALANLVF